MLSRRTFSLTSPAFGSSLAMHLAPSGGTGFVLYSSPFAPGANAAAASACPPSVPDADRAITCGRNDSPFNSLLRCKPMRCCWW